MDIQRPNAARNRLIRRVLYSGLGLVLVLSISFGVSRLKPASPVVERASIWIDAVKRGPMIRQVRGLGTLVPEEIRWIPALTEGRVERVRVLPGAIVKPDTILLDLSNPELQLAVLDAQAQLKAAEAEYSGLRVTLESQRLDQQATAVRVETEYHQAKLRADRDELLAKDGLTPDLTLRLSLATANELAKRYEIEKKRLDIYGESIEAQLAVQRTKVEQFKALFELKQSQVKELQVKAGIDGVLQQLPVEVGQRVMPGTNLARVSEPKRLKAELKIPETQARDILVGQKASIDTRNGVIPGHVTRIDPAAQNGTVAVDVAIEGELPKGARPDLSVDGTIEIERLDDVLFVGRPVQSQSDSLVSLFKLEEDGKGAVRVKVRLGRSSVNTIEIIDGLRVGDQAILSDMSSWDAYDRVRFN
jgi:HlyD family secretion protein